MSTQALNAALRACAAGFHPAEASVELLIAHHSWLTRNDFRDRFVHYGTSPANDAVVLAEIDWTATVTAVNAGDLPASSGEYRMLRLAASIANGHPVDLCDCLTGLDHHNINLLISAIRHASGMTVTQRC
jgi:hypothetical protein